MRNVEPTCHEQEIVQCESGGVDTTPVQEVLLWKNFAKYARAVDKTTTSKKSGTQKLQTEYWLGGDGTDDIIEEANEVTSIIMMNQKILDGLMESIEQNCAIINLQ